MYVNSLLFFVSFISPHFLYYLPCQSVDISVNKTFIMINGVQCYINFTILRLKALHSSAN